MKLFIVLLVSPWTSYAVAKGECFTKMFTTRFYVIPAVDVVCTRKMSKSVTLSYGEEFAFKTQNGKNYPARSKCQISYKTDSSCPSIKFSCSDFDVASSESNCKGGDKMTIVADGKTQK